MISSQAVGRTSDVVVQRRQAFPLNSRRSQQRGVAQAPSELASQFSGISGPPPLELNSCTRHPVAPHAWLGLGKACCFTDRSCATTPFPYPPFPLFPFPPLCCAITIASSSLRDTGRIGLVLRQCAVCESLTAYRAAAVEVSQIREVSTPSFHPHFCALFIYVWLSERSIGSLRLFSKLTRYHRSRSTLRRANLPRRR